MKSSRGLKTELVVLGVIAAFVPGRECAKAELVWGTAVNLGASVNSPFDEFGPSTSADGLTLYFSSNRPDGSGGYDLWVSTRATVTDDWGPAVNLGQPPNSQYSYWEPSVSSDGLSLYFSDGHSPQYGNHLPDGLGGQGDIWVVTRASIHNAWGSPINLGLAVNSQHATSPSISADGLSLYFQSHRPGALGHCDITVATRESTSDSFGDPVFLQNVNSGGPEWTPDISADGLTLFFMRNPGPPEIWASKRRTTDDDFGAPFRLSPPVNIPGYGNGIPHLSADGSTLYFVSTRPGGSGGWDLWQVPIIPTVDLNADGKVDFRDFSKLAQHWGQHAPSCDVAPRPFGDSAVDIKDMATLADHWLERANPVTYWKLDETRGHLAHDSIGDSDAFVMALEPGWRPEAGAVGGAIELDGVGEYIQTEFVLNPSTGPFSLFCWVKGGLSGQTIVSQDGTADWLMTDVSAGCLTTDIAIPGRGGQALLSEVLITDGLWHRVGLVRDLGSLTLYVDDLQVASGSDSGLRGSQAGLQIGAGRNRAAGSFWSGMIDDVRIYDRAVTP